MSEHTHAETTEKKRSQTPAEETAAFESAPLASSPLYDTLHQSMGNRALGRLLETQRAASNEAPTRVSAEQQRQIEGERAGGLPLEGAPGARLHYGENAQALSRGL